MKGVISNLLGRRSIWRGLWLGILLWVVFCLGMGQEISPALAQTVALTNGSETDIQPYLQRVRSQISEFTLANGLKFIVLERHQAPVISFLTYANVGGANEPEGQTGVAHYLEHLAFKGTHQIGTRDYAAEAPLLVQEDQLFEQIKTARDNNQPEKLERLQRQFAQLEEQASRYVIQNQLGQIVSQAGGVGLNANTSSEATRYFYSFPSNKLELWMSLESERFLEPVFREFFKEKEVILEERRMRTENSAIGQLIEVFLDKAFTLHPYRRPVIGSGADIRNLTRSNVQDFFNTYYVPNNLTIAVVGDVNPQQVQQLAKTYFGRYSPGPSPPKVTVVEPPQTTPQQVTLKLASQPWYLEGYHCPAIADPDFAIYELIASLLSDGRTSRLYQSLVSSQKIALGVQGNIGFPGSQYPNLILFYALTAPGHSLEQVAAALQQEIGRLRTELVPSEELERVKKKARTGLLRSLDSNSGMAQSLLEYQVKTGDWRNLFRQVEAIAAVTPTDIQRVARATFTPENRTIGKILSQDP
jgi:predicted Zn-dependent peptidase